MYAETHVTKLPSGQEIELKRLKGRHQEWLTKGKSQARKSTGKKNPGEKGMDDVLHDCTVRLGDIHNPTLQDVQRMLSGDFAFAIMALRFFSCDPYFAERQAEKAKHEAWVKMMQEEAAAEGGVFEAPEFESQLPPHTFTFTYEYQVPGTNKKKKHEYDLELYLDDFEVKPYQDQLPSYEPATLELYRHRSLILPICKKEIFWDVLNVETEHRFKALLQNEEEVSSSTFLKCRKPVEMKPTGTGGVAPLQLNLSDLEILDIEEIRRQVHKAEGQVDTRIIVKHPLDKTEIPVNVVNVVAFFFPSGVA